MAAAEKRQVTVAWFSIHIWVRWDRTSHRQKLVAHQAQVPLPQSTRAQKHPAIPAEMPAFAQHQYHPEEEWTWLRLLLAQ